MEAADETVRGIPARYLSKIEEKVDMLQEYCDDTGGWEFLFEKDGMTARKKPGEKLMVRADAELAFDIQSIFDMVIDNKKLPEINPQVDRAKRVKEFSANTFTQHIVFKQVWPTAPRDMVNMTHWRVLKSGRIVIVSFNCEEYHEGDVACKVDSGVVRADLTLGGYVLTPTKTGTKVLYCVCSDLRGTIPTSVSNTVLRKQPLIVTSIQKNLRSSGKGVPSSGQTIDASAIQSNALTSAKSMLVFKVKDSKKGGRGAKGQQGGRENQNSGDDEENVDGTVDDATILSLFPLLLPVLIHFLCHSQLWTLAAVISIIPYTYKKLIVDPLTAGSVEHEKFVETPPGRILIKLAPELERLLKFVQKRKEEKGGGIEFSLTHLVVKAIAKALKDTPSLNGYMIGNRFYKARNSSIELSVCTDSTDMAAINIKDAHKKELSVIATELQSQSKLIRSGTREPSKSQVLLDAIPQPVMFVAVSTLKFFGLYQAICSASTATGMGKAVCRVLSMPRSDQGLTLDGGDFTFIPHQSSILLSDMPTSITIGDVTMKTVLAEEGQAKNVPVLNLSISINSNAVSLAQAKNFSITLRKYLNTPTLDL